MGAYSYPLMWIAAGLVTLLVGGESLVRGSSKLALALGINPLVIGLTVVAFGTSSPELAVSVLAAIDGKMDVALGNVVGSNILNVLLILGLSAIVTPLIVASQLIKFDVPAMIAASLLVLAMGLDGAIGVLDGAILFSMLIAYTAWVIRLSRRESEKVKAEFEDSLGVADNGSKVKISVQIGTIVIGLLFLCLGARWLVSGAVDIARLLGIDELVIGLTIVAVGTSLPELITSVLASIHRQPDIAVGNIVGSNIFNILGVLGLSGLISGTGVLVSPEALWIDIPVMIGVAVVTLPIVFTDSTISRKEGTFLISAFVVYTTYRIFFS
ncbi:MAG: calcium/sodium antiporter [Deltaproteobacteria bacterium]|nr:calcium/sodium antiporter [Deltaproteobacteria bacterium]